MTGARERELKFQFDSGEAVERAVDAVLAGAVRNVQQIETVYFDTASHDLRAHGLTLRVRRAGSRYIQTIKQTSGSALTRWETEHDVLGPTPRIEAADRKALAHVAVRAGKDAFRPVFTVKSERTTWNGEASGAAIEFALDRGEVLAGGQSAALNELEIELKQGAPAGLFDLARRISALVALRPTIFTKGERGYRLLDESWGRAVHAEPVALSKKMSAREGFRAIAMNCLQHYMLNEMVVRGACDSNAVHQGRIAIRRLRSALSLFAPLVRDARFETVKADLKWLSDALGAVRDLDVFQTRVVKPCLAEEPDLIGLDRLAAYVETQKQMRYAALIAELGSEACRKKLLDLIEWVETGAWSAGEDKSPPVLKFAAHRVRRRWKDLAVEGAHLRRLNDEQLHDLRKRTKRLRYAADFFAGLKTGKARARFKDAMGTLEALQTKLGRQHDLVFFGRMLTDIAQRGEGASPAMLFAAGRLAGDMQAQFKVAGLRGAQRAADGLNEAAPL